MNQTFKVLLYTLFITCLSAFGQSPERYILDADTANELDDYYAIFQAIASPEMELISLNSAQFNSSQIFMDSIWNGNKVTNFNSVTLSQAANETLLKGLNRMDIPHPQGCETHLGYAYGYWDGAFFPTSPATAFIIKEAKKASPSNKLKIICIGASTNLAAAIEAEPKIAKNIHAYLLGAQFDATKNVWNKNEFNIRRDLNAFDALLNQTDMEMTVMPITPVRPFVFDKTKTLERLYKIDHAVPKLLGDVWTDINAGQERIMWDLALILAIQKPELATLEDRPAPPENKRDTLHVYTAIDIKGMHSEFWNTLEGYFKEQ
ncbi:nucleoside hydrolase [Tamlana sp. I1]|uniref:nucleoside hydrolase n=1 Tax=Tamlana sp. I1 TaxID=2762061 RepID=UPI00188FA6A0|nr:nucleoside hydrolase [Tamlana sp. I1]